MPSVHSGLLKLKLNELSDGWLPPQTIMRSIRIVPVQMLSQFGIEIFEVTEYQILVVIHKLLLERAVKALRISIHFGTPRISVPSATALGFQHTLEGALQLASVGITCGAQLCAPVSNRRDARWQRYSRAAGVIEVVSTPATVTVCRVFQFVVVNVSDVGDTLTMPVAVDASVTITSSIGSVFRLTVYLTAMPPSDSETMVTSSRSAPSNVRAPAMAA